MFGTRISRVAAVAAIAVLAACQQAPTPFLEIAGWTPQDEAASYDAAGLWELINGAADTFLAYGFEGVTVQRFAEGERVVTVSAYDMGTPLNAFGIYRTEAPRELPALAVGTEAVVSPPYQALLVKDRFYVKVDAYEGEIDDAAGSRLAEAIAAALPGAGGLPTEFAALPAEGMIPGSAEYTRRDFLGLAGLDDCVHAAYRSNDGAEYRAFAVVVDAATVWSRLAASWQPAELDGLPVLSREVPYSGLVGVARTDRGIIGIADAADLAQLMERLRPLAP